MIKELKKQESSLKDKEEAPQMTKEKESQVGPQDLGGTIKEVQQVYRSPTQTEKGNKSDGEDTRPEEMSDVELHVEMEQLF